MQYIRPPCTIAKQQRIAKCERPGCVWYAAVAWVHVRSGLPVCADAWVEGLCLNRHLSQQAAGLPIWWLLPTLCRRVCVSLMALLICCLGVNIRYCTPDMSCGLFWKSPCHPPLIVSSTPILDPILLPCCARDACAGRLD